MSSVRRKNTRPPDFTTSRSCRCGSGLMSWTSAIRRLPRSPARRRSRVLARVLQGLLEAVAAERLQQVVERVHLEGLERVLVVGGDEDHQSACARRRPARMTPKPSHGRHLHVEEDEVGLRAAGWPTPPAGRRRTRRRPRRPAPARAGRRCARAPSARRPRPAFGSWSRDPLDVLGHVASSDHVDRPRRHRNGIVTITASPPPAGCRNSKPLRAPRTGARAASACWRGRRPFRQAGSRGRRQPRHRCLALRSSRHRPGAARA